MKDREMAGERIACPLKPWRRRKVRGNVAAFTAVELVIVMTIIAILAVAVVVGSSGIARMRVDIAVERVKGDIRYAQEEACTRHVRTWVEFDAANEMYSLYAGEDKATRVPMTEPLTREDYVIRLNEGEYSGVEITGVDFSGKDTLEFDSMGTPYDWWGNRLDPDGTVTIAGSIKVVVIKDTGMVRIEK